MSQNKLVAGKKYNITYVKGDNDDVTLHKKTIVTVSVPDPTVKAIDVSDVSSQEASKIAEQSAEYQEYVKMKLSQILSFEDWRDHSGITGPALKWRSYVPTKIVIDN